MIASAGGIVGAAVLLALATALTWRRHRRHVTAAAARDRMERADQAEARAEAILARRGLPPLPRLDPLTHHLPATPPSPPTWVVRQFRDRPRPALATAGAAGLIAGLVVLPLLLGPAPTLDDGRGPGQRPADMPPPQAIPAPDPEPLPTRAPAASDHGSHEQPAEGEPPAESPATTPAGVPAPEEPEATTAPPPEPTTPAPTASLVPVPDPTEEPPAEPSPPAEDGTGHLLCADAELLGLAELEACLG